MDETKSALTPRHNRRAIDDENRTDPESRGNETRNRAGFRRRSNDAPGREEEFGAQYLEQDAACLHAASRASHPGAAPVLEAGLAFAAASEIGGQPLIAGYEAALTLLHQGYRTTAPARASEMNRLDRLSATVCNQLIFSNSTSKTSVAFGGITLPAPRAP